MLRRTPMRPRKGKVWKTLQRGSPLKRVSKKLQGEHYKYVAVRKAYMITHPHCERCLLKGTTRKSEELHHRKGRGKYLLVVEYFAALCCYCHSLCKSEWKMMESEGWVLDRIGNNDIEKSQTDLEQ